MKVGFPASHNWKARLHCKSNSRRQIIIHLSTRTYCSPTMASSIPEKLRQQFVEIPAEQQSTGWNALWTQKFTPWDRDLPSPALVDTLNQKADLFGPRSEKATARRRALVPGCGRGYDVLLFASHGYDAYGLDAAETAIESARTLQAEQGNDETKYPVRSSLGRGVAEFVTADFFKDDFLENIGGGSFDVVYDYTFLCALPPDLRAKWAKRMSQLLAPEGRLVCLEFPLGKDPKLGGPPHGLTSELYEELFKSPGREVQYDAAGWVSPDSQVGVSGDALERIAHWRPEHTHAVGQGKDMVSVWRHKQS